GLARKDAFIYVLPGTNQALVNMTHLATPLDPVGASQMVVEGHRQLDQAFAFLQAEFPEVFGHAIIDRYGQPGVRQTRWIKGLYRSMVHAEADNLLAAGRCIDGDVLALSSVRVMGPCIAMGTAAAHAAHLAGSLPLRDVDVHALRQRVARNLGEAG